MYAVLDCVDFLGLSNVIPPWSEVHPLSCLPSEDYITLLKRDMPTMISMYAVTRNIISLCPHLVATFQSYCAEHGVIKRVSKAGAMAYPKQAF